MSVRDLRFGEFLCGLWATACEVLAVPTARAASTTQELRELLPAWADERIGAAPRQPSFVAADGFPAEMSVNWSGGRPELRVLFDSLADPSGGWSALAATSSRFGQVSEVFAAAPLWYSMAWRPPARVVHKVYFGLYAWPPARRMAALARAMERLGMAVAWDDARRRVDANGRADDREVEFLSLDLVDGGAARVKIYYRNHGADIHEMNRMASVALDHDAEAALAAYRALAGGSAEAGSEALTCLAFRAGLGRAAESTTYLRMPSLAETDQEAVDRVAELLRRQGGDPRPVRALAAAFVPAEFTGGQRMLELVSHRTARHRDDLTTYFRFPVYDQPAPLPVTHAGPARA